jgi:molybdopterin molybdotransferase
MTPECPCCPDPAGRTPLTKDEALRLLLAEVRPPAETERIATELGLGRVLAEPLTAAVDVPDWDNSAMDGYALSTADLVAPETRLRVAQRIPAGQAGLPLQPGTAARIFTGAPVPAGADAVVIQEDCTRDGDWVLVPAGRVRPGGHIRRAGEDLRRGEVVCPAGTRLAPQHLGLAASAGAATLSVYRRLRVAALSTGDELVPPGEPLGPGQIYDSNRCTLIGLLRGLGCEVLDLGRVPDTLDASLEALSRGAAESDLVIASGGVSVGEEDHIKSAVARLGALTLWNVAVRPGKPLAFGRVGGTHFLGSPGNPVSLFVTFCLFARPLVLRLQGQTGDLSPPPIRVRAGFDWPHPDRRRELLRARLTTGSDGETQAVIHPSRSAAVLSSVAWADGLLEIPEGRALKSGDPVDFIPFAWLLH